MSSNRLVALALAGLLAGCTESPSDPALSRSEPAIDRPLNVGEHVPDRAEAEVVGAATGRIERGSDGFARLVRCEDPRIVFKDEEETGADRMMSRRLRSRLRRLGRLTAEHWPEVRLRVTEAWDEDGEHGAGSAHYEGRAADLTASDLDSGKLGQLATLAVEAGLDWVFYEDATHVHVSVRR